MPILVCILIICDWMFFKLVEQCWISYPYGAALSSVGQASCRTLPVFIQQAELWNIIPVWHMVRTKKNWEWPPWVHAPLHTDTVLLLLIKPQILWLYQSLLSPLDCGFWICQGVPNRFSYSYHFIFNYYFQCFTFWPYHWILKATSEFHLDFFLFLYSRVGQNKFKAHITNQITKAHN